MSKFFIKADNASLELPLVRQQQNESLFSIRGLFTNIGSSERINRTVLKNISIEINEGDRVGLTGRNGSGKTTLLKLLSGIYHPKTGTLTSNGRLLCVINPQFGLQAEASGYENIILRGLHLDMSINEMRKKADSIIAFSELEEAINDPLYTYSAGMRARLAISILLHSNPDILLIDEWIGAGDRDFQAKAANRLLEFVEQAKLMVVATHNQQLLNKLCNRVLTLNKGEIIDDSLITEASSDEKSAENNKSDEAKPAFNSDH
jgi:ABC-type polysaccharide/polyol phosphate transport system ATPase subunit